MKHDRPDGPRVTIAGLGRAIAWIALAAALARPSAPGERLGAGHVGFAVLACLVVRASLESIRAVRRAQSIPGRLFAVAGALLAVAVLALMLGARYGEAGFVFLLFVPWAMLLGATGCGAAGLIAWLIEVALAWRDHLHGRPRYILPPPRDEGHGPRGLGS